MFLRILRENSRFVAIILVVSLDLTAQYLFTGEVFTHNLPSDTWAWKPSFSIALSLLLLAVGFAYWASIPQKNTETEASDVVKFLEDKPGQRANWFKASVGCYLVSIVIYLLVGENAFVRWLWLASIALLIIPLWVRYRGRAAKRGEDRIPGWEWAVVGIVTLIGFVLRYWKLTEIPAHIDNDIALMGVFAQNLIREGNFNWIGLSGSDHLLSYDQYLAWGMRLFGQNHYGVVMQSVIFGTLALVCIFLLGREWGGTFMGFLAMCLLTISYTHIHFSRILFGSSVSCISIIIFYSLVKGLRTREYFWFALAGLMIGWGMLLYDSSRIFPVVTIAIVIWQWLFQRPSFRYKNWMMAFAGVLVGFGPMLAYALANFSTFAGRANVVVLWNPDVWKHQWDSYNVTNSFQLIWQQIWRTFLTLHLTGDGSPHFAFPAPMVSSLTALLFILGTGYCLARIKDIKYFAVLGSIVFTFIFGGVLTVDPPYWPHLNIALPSIMLVAAIGTKKAADVITRQFGLVGRNIFSWILVAAVIFTGIGNMQSYYNIVQNNSGPRNRISRYVASLSPSYIVYMVSTQRSWDEYMFQFFNQKREGGDLTPDVLVTAPPVIQQPTVFILFLEPELVPVLQRLYPSGNIENHYDYNNLESFISYSVVPHGYKLAPVVNSIDPLKLPGWWLIFGVLIFLAGGFLYREYQFQREKLQEFNGSSRI